MSHEKKKKLKPYLVMHTEMILLNVCGKRSDGQTLPDSVLVLVEKNILYELLGDGLGRYNKFRKFFT